MYHLISMHSSHAALQHANVVLLHKQHLLENVEMTGQTHYITYIINTVTFFSSIFR